MSYLTSDIGSVPQDIFSSSALKYAELGARAVDGNGREFRYIKAGGVALVPGTLLQSSAEDTAHQNLAPTANYTASTVTPVTSIQVTLGASAVTANQYQDGWVIVTTSTGAGYQYQISSHPAAEASATLVLNLADPLLANLASASSKIDLVANTYSAVVINPTTATSAPIGAAVYPVAIGQYGWAQVKGPASVLADGAVTVGTGVVASNGTAGAVEALTGVQAPVGTAITGIATTQYGAINLDL